MADLAPVAALLGGALIAKGFDSLVRPEGKEHLDPTTLTGKELGTDRWLQGEVILGVILSIFGVLVQVRLMHFVFQITKVVLLMMKFVFQMMNFALKMMILCSAGCRSGGSGSSAGSSSTRWAAWTVRPTSKALLALAPAAANHAAGRGCASRCAPAPGGRRTGAWMTTRR